MPPPDQKYPPPGPANQGEKLDVRRLHYGVIFDEEHREELLQSLADRGLAENAKQIPPPPPPPPKPVSLLYPFLLAVFPSWTYGLQGRGDCMAWSATHSIDILMAVNIALDQQPERATALSSIEAQYGLMRVEVYDGIPDHGGDGASPSGAAESVQKCGTLHRLRYLSDKYDLTTYDDTGGRSGSWGRWGVPDELEPIALEHPAERIALVTDFDSAVKLLSQGIPISNASPRNPIWTHRDERGFGDEQWKAPHAMNYIGYRLGDRPGLLKINTGHGYHVDGDMYPHDCPTQIANCAAWEDADVVDQVLADEWSWAYWDYTGFPAGGLARFLLFDLITQHQTTA